MPSSIPDGTGPASGRGLAATVHGRGRCRPVALSRSGGNANTAPVRAPMIVVALNLAAHDAAFEAARAAGHEVVHARYETSWEEISARRRSVLGAAEPVSDDLGAALARAEVVVGFAMPRDLVGLAPRLRWVASIATGVDHLRGTGVLEADVPLTTVGGLFAPTIAEHVFAAILHFARRLDDFAAQRRERTWRARRVRGLAGGTLGLVGVGRIGGAVALRAKAFGMTTVGVGRGPARGRRVAGVDRLLDRAELPVLLAAADWVVLAVADVPETRGMIGAAELGAMRPEAVLVNVGRGTTVDEPALVAALERGAVAGAALDVFAHEPLPATSPLWTLPNVLVTPHVATNVVDYVPRALAQFTENLARFAAGTPLENRFDRARGY
jgi:phosphoglycerate dehydrogenase-like enzyme